VVKNQRDGTRGSDVVDGGAFNLVPCMAVVAPILEEEEWGVGPAAGAMSNLAIEAVALAESVRQNPGQVLRDTQAAQPKRELPVRE
jgi:hypothetical protein